MGNRCSYAVFLVLLFAPTVVFCDWPALHKAAYEGDVIAAKSLISAGALLNQKDFKCVTGSFLQPEAFLFVILLQ